MENVYSVSQVNNYVKLLIQNDILLNNIFIEGEISNFKNHTSGHFYFTIKDFDASLNCIMFENNARNIDFDIKNGAKIIANGYLSLYPKTGMYQFSVRKIYADGKGILQKNFEILKEKLENEGLFDIRYKKPISKIPKNIAVITSKTGAALQDIIKIYKRRNKSVNLILIPSTVQGEKAPKELIDAIYLANKYENLDTIILARGGGSYEDLNCFNSEDLARAIFASKIPIITGIGHETDFTIADFVSDLRAQTPSAAIEIALPEAEVLSQKLEHIFQKMDYLIKYKINYNKNKLNTILQQNAFYNFEQKVLNYKNFANNNFNSLQKSFYSKYKEKRLFLKNCTNKLDYLFPANILKNGYAFVLDNNNKQIKSAKSLKKGDIINITFFDGKKQAEIF